MHSDIFADTSMLLGSCLSLRCISCAFFCSLAVFNSRSVSFGAIVLTSLLRRICFFVVASVGHKTAGSRQNNYNNSFCCAIFSSYFFCIFRLFSSSLSTTSTFRRHRVDFHWIAVSTKVSRYFCLLLSFAIAFLLCSFSATVFRISTFSFRFGSGSWKMLCALANAKQWHKYIKDNVADRLIQNWNHVEAFCSFFTPHTSPSCRFYSIIHSTERESASRTCVVAFRYPDECNLCFRF